MMKTLGMGMIVVGMFFAVVGGDSKDSTAQAQAAGAGVKAKELVLDLGDKVPMKLVLIPAGKFLMGPETEERRKAAKEPQHEVTIGNPFYMGQTHVTVDQFAAYVKASWNKTEAERRGSSFGFQIRDGKLDIASVDRASWRRPGFDQKGDHPVVQVSWNDAQVFCVWLSGKSGRTVSLPTEAQWEYACRAGTKTAYPWGDNPDDGKGWANCADQSLKKKLPNAPADWKFFSWDDGFVFTSPVGSFKANAFGLHDMIGNVWQWCEDRYDYSDKQPATAPTGANRGSILVLRGGSWHPDSGVQSFNVLGPLAVHGGSRDVSSEMCRSACRLSCDTRFDSLNLSLCGFRVTVAAGAE